MRAGVTSSAPGSRFPNVVLWVAQVLVFGGFASAAALKLSLPVPRLAAMFPWMGQLPEAFVRATGLVDLAGGGGVLLPTLTRIKPGLAVPAALGCSVLMVLAIVFHVSRGEAPATPFNGVLLALFVLWGRARQVPVAPRSF